MKIAICISGQPRNFKHSYISLKKYFLDKYDCDIYFHSWKTPTFESTNFGDWPGFLGNDRAYPARIFLNLSMIKTIMEDLEKTKTKIGNFNLPAVPKFGFIDAIKRFIFFTFLGIAFPKLLEIAPKIIELGRNLYPAVKFFGEIGKTLVSSLVTFIDWGYKIRDNTEKVAKQIGGEKFADNGINCSIISPID